uniref:Uncharacterized protein n=1 Tax=Arundo donax TaxID=35708 RepID=A0A0A9F228_ARUDO
MVFFLHVCLAAPNRIRIDLEFPYLLIS